MLLTNRLFKRKAPEKDAKSIYIFCEGQKREYQYFQYFKGIDSKINIEVYHLTPQEDNSPTGLYEIAKRCLLRSEDNPDPQYEFLETDEVWFVIDTDKWGIKIYELRAYCQSHTNWKIAQSNPCFEVWLYYHLFDARATFPWIENCTEWKSFLTDSIPGGFDSRKHPIYVEKAIKNAVNHFEEADGMPNVGNTEVFSWLRLFRHFVAGK